MKLLVVVTFLALICAARLIPVKGPLSSPSLSLPTEPQADELGPIVDDEEDEENDDDVVFPSTTTKTTNRRTTYVFPTKTSKRPRLTSRTTTPVDDNEDEESAGGANYFGNIIKFLKNLFGDVKKFLRNLTAADVFKLISRLLKKNDDD